MSIPGDGSGSGIPGDLTGGGVRSGASGFDALFSSLSQCGSRSVNPIPTDTYVEIVTLESEFEVSPPDSALARVLYPSSICDGAGVGNPFGDFDATGLMKVGPNGEITETCSLLNLFGNMTVMCIPSFDFCSFEQRFEAIGGCLDIAFNFDPHECQQPEIELPDQVDLDFDPTELIVADVEPIRLRCNFDEVPITRDGRASLIDVGSGEPYICVRVEVEDFCRNCGEEDGVWFESTTSRLTVTARGSLDNVSAAAFAQSCGNDENRVDIQSGDRVTIIETERTEYRISPSPEELGFSAVPPGFDFDLSDRFMRQ